MVRQTRRGYLKTSVATATALTIAGCTGNGDGGDGGGGGGGGGGADKVIIGNLQPTQASTGKNAVQGVELATQELKENWDTEIEVITKDTEASAEVGVKRARELVEQENVDVLLGIASSSVASAVSDYAAGQDVVTVVSQAQGVEITGEKCKKTTFRTGSHLGQLNAGAAFALAEATGAKRIAAIAPNYSFGKQTWYAFRDAYKQKVDGAEVILETYPKFGKGNYQNEIQKLINQEPDLVYNSLWPGTLVNFIKQGKQNNFFEEVPDMIYGTGAIAGTSEALGDEMVDLWALTRYWFNNPDTERNNDFVSAFRDKFSEVPTGVSQEAYAAMYAVKHAVDESGGKSKDDLISGLEGLEFEAPEGTKKIRAEDHQVIDEKIWTGKTGEVDYWENYGFTELATTPGADVTDEPNCNF
jgi:branched-chain amino acid transport system substrate-binding protein